MQMRSIWNLIFIILCVLLAAAAGSLSATVAASGYLIVFGSVAGSYVLRHYEVCNPRPSSAAPTYTASLPERFGGMLEEAAAVCACIFLFPFGYFSAGSARRELIRGERPLILCHGYLNNHSSMLWLGRQLRRGGRCNIIIPNFRPRNATIPEFAASLSRTVQKALEQTGVQKVDLVGHSMGGMVVRYYIECLGGAPFVRSAVTIGSPHRGTKMAVLGLFKSALQFRLNSSVVCELQETAPAPEVNMISIWSEFDNIVLPPENALLEHPYQNVMVKNVGHVALLFSKQVAAQLRLALCKAETA